MPPLQKPRACITILLHSFQYTHRGRSAPSGQSSSVQRLVWLFWRRSPRLRLSSGSAVVAPGSPLADAGRVIGAYQPPKALHACLPTCTSVRNQKYLYTETSGAYGWLASRSSPMQTAVSTVCRPIVVLDSPQAESGLSRACHALSILPRCSPLLMWIPRSSRPVLPSFPLAADLSPTSIVRFCFPQRAVSPTLFLTILLNIPRKHPRQ